MALGKGKAAKSSSGASMSAYDVEVESRLKALEAKVKELESHEHAAPATTATGDDHEKLVAVEAALNEAKIPAKSGTSTGSEAKIQVNPGQKLSLQRHYHRSEHWVIVEGVALVQIEDKETLVFENQSTYIPSNTMHRLSNPGKIPLKVIEVQSGAYLEEDDIERFDDEYGRKD